MQQMILRASGILALPPFRKKRAKGWGKEPLLKGGSIGDPWKGRSRDLQVPEEQPKRETPGFQPRTYSSAAQRPFRALVLLGIATQGSAFSRSWATRTAPRTGSNDSG